MAYLPGNDRIYRLKFLKDNTVEGELLHKGNLNFSKEHPIETLNFYESESIHKVYFIDGKNQLRFFNKNSNKFELWNDYSFDYIPKLDLNEIITITSDSTIGGVFHSGTIQYAFTYYNMYGQESNIFYISPLYNISLISRAGSPEEIVSTSFRIKIAGFDRKFDYIRIYSIHYTSVNNFNVNIVGDYNIPKNINDKEVNIEVIDSGLYKESIEKSTLIFMGGDHIIPNAFTQKDGTLFIGNYSLLNNTIGNIKIPKKNSSLSTDLYKLLFKGNEGMSLPGLDNKATSFIELSNKEMMADLTHGKYYSYKPDSLNNKKTTGTNIGKFESFKTFKTNEVYRMGIQFQHISGNWSEPLFVNDKTIDLLNKTEPIYYTDKDISFIKYSGVQAKLTIHDNNWYLIKTLVENGFVKVRPVVVYPNIYERKVVAQGVVNPSMYFCDDRISKNIHSTSSWFFRPMIQKKKSPSIIGNYDNLYYDDGSIQNNEYGATNYSGRFSKFGTFAEWRHNFALPSSRKYDSYDPAFGLCIEYTNNYGMGPLGYINQEIQSLHHKYLINSYCNMGYKTPSGTIVPSYNALISNPNGGYYSTLTPEHFEKLYANEPFIDQNIITFHSPDVEQDVFFNNINKEDLDFKIVGYVNFTSFISDKFNTISTNKLEENSFGFIEKTCNKLNSDTDIGINDIIGDYTKDQVIKTTPGGNLLISAPLYRDKKILDPEDEEYGDYTTFPIYPWHTIGKSLVYENSSEKAKLEYNKTSNLRYSSFNTYLSSPKNLYTPQNDSINSRESVVTLSKVSLYNYENSELIKLYFEHPKMQNIFYQGNVDKLVNTSPSLHPKGYPLLEAIHPTPSNNMDNLLTENQKYNHYYKQGYYIMGSTQKFVFKFDPVLIKYKTTPHLVFGFEPTNFGNYTSQPILPSCNGNYNLNGVYGQPFWDDTMWYISQNNIEVKHNNNITNTLEETEFGGLWLVELWRKDAALKHRFGDMLNEYGDPMPTQESLEKLQWLPCGEPVSLIGSNGFPKTFVNIEYTEGDTFLQRYDCLKTFGNITDKQSITEVLSFVCESRIASDGRYDNLRGNPNISYIDNTKFNLVNTVYSQKNNYFTYSSLNYNKSYVKDFPTSIIWTSSKTPGSIIDNWTKFNLLTSINCDGTSGQITSLINYDNKIIGFQPKGIFEVLFNSRVQIPTSDNTPIEISSNYKVEGINYHAKNIGTLNKWSINNDSLGTVYFIDDFSNCLYTFPKLENLSASKGFYNWSRSNFNKLVSWEPKTFSNFRSFYNNLTKDIYLVSENTCLAYSQFIDQFTSYYDYHKVPFMFNILNKFIAIEKDRTLTNDKFYLWDQNSGEYNKFFNKNYGYHIEYIVNGESSTVKIFDTLEFRGDSFVDNELNKFPLFDTLSVFNENQQSDQKLLTTDLYSTKNLIGRNKIWRTFIPRDKNLQASPSVSYGYNYNKNRMMGTHLYLKLSSTGSTNHKTILKDIIVYMRK